MVRLSEIAGGSQLDEGQQRSMLDLAITPKILSVDIEVSQVWDTSQMQHSAIFIWAHLG